MGRVSVGHKIINITSASSRGVAVTQLIATLCAFYALAMHVHSALWWLSLAVYFCTGCLGITVTFHRYLCHRSFKMKRSLEYLFSFFGALGGTGSALGWVALHRAHHQYSDQQLDPHSPVNGKFKIFFSQYNFSLNKWTVRDMIADPFHRYVHGYYYILLLIWASVWLAISFKLFLFVVAVPMALQIWISSISNCVNHMLGYRNFETADHSTNNAIVALLSWGEGWHNNHHKYPSNWSFQVKWWEFDISSFVIRLIRTGGSHKRA